MSEAHLADKNDRVHFWYGPDKLDRFEVYLDDEDHLWIRTPQASLAVRPWSSNAVHVQAVERS